MSKAPVKLKRELKLWPVILFGLGNILGAGIYALVGVVASSAAYFTPLAFIVALILALFTALSYMEFSSRFPLSSGEAYYIHQAFDKQWLSVFIGLMTSLGGLISSATMMRSFVGYMGVFESLSWLSDFDWLLIIVVVFIIGLLAVWGINESVFGAAVLTLIEAGGLLFIIWVARGSLEHLPSKLPELIMSFDLSSCHGVFIGAFIAFYAFIGFEDMVTIAEEVKEPRKNMPLAILGSFLIATILYISVSLIAVLALEPELLAHSKAPMADIYRASTGASPIVITLISIFAVLNGALIQIVKASRIFYGMSVQKWLPHLFSIVNPVTRTPVWSTLICILIILSFALVLPLKTLAVATSFTVLVVFTLINLALIKLKLDGVESTKSEFNLPMIVPVLGFVFSVAIVVFKIFY